MSEAREYPGRPFVSVGVVIYKDDEILLVKRGKAPRKGEWSFPGGAQHIGETVAQAAHREVLEETGLEIELGPLIEVVDSISTDDQGDVQYHYTLLDYLGLYKNGEASAADDVSDVKWVDLETANRLLKWPESRSVLHKSVRIRKKTA